jgi:hypothetical protein
MREEERSECWTAWEDVNKGCEEAVVYEVRWLGMVGHSGGVSMVLWRRTFCPRACFDTDIGKNCTTSLEVQKSYGKI